MLHTYDTRHRSRISHARGYTLETCNYGYGTPGHHSALSRNRDRQIMWEGPFVSDTPFIHSDWMALPVDERKSIVSALHSAPHCQGCEECETRCV